MVDVDDEASDPDYTINIGVSIEPLSTVESVIAAQNSQGAESKSITNTQKILSSTDIVAPLANKIFQHAYNFMSGFTTPDGKVPLKVLDDWWNKFKSKIQNNPRFLDDEFSR